MTYGIFFGIGRKGVNANCNQDTENQLPDRALDSSTKKYFMSWSRELSISKGDHLSYYLRILETKSASLQLLDSNVPEGDYGES